MRVNVARKLFAFCIAGFVFLSFGCTREYKGDLKIVYVIPNGIMLDNVYNSSPEQIFSAVGTYWGICFSPDGSKLYISTLISGTYSVSEIDIESKQVRNLYHPLVSITSETVSPSGKYIAFTENTNTVVIDRNGTVVSKFPTSGETTMSIEEPYLYAISNNWVVKYNFLTGVQVSSVSLSSPLTSDSLASKSFTSDEIGSVSISNMTFFQTIPLTGYASNIPIGTITVPSSSYEQISFSPDGKIVALYDSNLRLYDLEKQTTIRTIPGGGYASIQGRPR